MIVTDWVLVVVGLVWLITAVICDIRTKEIPDWLNFSLIAMALGIRGIGAISMMDYMYFVWGLIGFAIFFVIACGMYYTRQWGGGDAKMLMALGALLATASNLGIFMPNLDIPFLASLIINLLVIGAAYGILSGLAIGIWKWKKLYKELMKQDKTLLIIGMSIGILVALFGGIFGGSFWLLFLILGLVFAVFVKLVFILKGVEACCMFKNVKIKDLMEGDWIQGDVKKGRKIILKYKRLGIDLKDINKLKRNNIKSVIVKEGVPFLPAFLIAYIVTIIIGNFIFIF